MSKFSIRAIAFAAIAALGFAPLTLSAPAPASAANSNYSFNACVQEKGSAHVIIMMDESGSIYGDNGTDPKNARISGAQILLDSLQAVANTYKKPINVQLAGFGDNFIARPSVGWTALEPGSDANLKKVVDATKLWADKEKTKNWRETDLVSAISGARDTFLSAPSESCKLFVFFKDGKDFHIFNSKSAKAQPVVGFPEIDKLLEARKFAKADAMAVNEICRDGGLADALRLDKNLFSVGIGISSGGEESEGFKKFRAVIEGKPTQGCKGGKEPANGQYLLAKDIGDLPGQFCKVLNPNSPCITEAHDFELDLKHALTSIRVLSSGVTSKTFSLMPPSTCSASKMTFKSADGEKQNVPIGTSATASVKWLGDNNNLETFSLVLKHTVMSDDSCWVGKWKFMPGEGATSYLTFDADLHALPIFKTPRPYVVPGNTDGAAYQIQIGKPSDTTGAMVPLTSLDKDITLSVNGFVRNIDTKQIESRFQEFTLTGNQLTDPRTLVAAAGQDLGKYELILTLDVKVAGFKYPLMPITTQTQVEVRTAKAPPTIVGIADFGTLNGNVRTKATIEFKGSAEEDYVVNFAGKETEIQASTFPEGVKYVFAFEKGQKQSFTIPKGSTAKVDVWVQAVSTSKESNGEIRAQMPVAGKLKISASPASEAATVVALAGNFKGIQKASSNGLIRTLLLILFVLIGVALSFLSIVFISGRLSRLPKKDVWVQYKFIDVEFNNQGFVNLSSIRQEVSNDQGFGDAFPDSKRKSITFGDQVLYSRGSGFNLSHVGHVEIPAALGSLGLSSQNPKAAQLPLSLTSSWLFYTDPANLSAAKQGTTVSGQALFVRLKFEQKTASALFDEFEQNAGAILNDRIMNAKEVVTAGPRPTYEWETPLASDIGSTPAKKQKSSLFGKKAPKQEPTQPTNINNLDQW